LQPDARAYLFDIRQAAELIARFTADRDLGDYLADPMLRSAVERQFEIVGEALSQLSKRDATLVTRISEHRRIIAFRNILIHAYSQIDDQLVWEMYRAPLSDLRAELEYTRSDS
jgi:uncharacterized protein with HEPN domain